MQSASKRRTFHQGLNEGFLIKQRSVCMGTMTAEWDVAGYPRILHFLVLIFKFRFFLCLSLTKSHAHCLYDVCKQTLAHINRLSLKTELLRCLTMSLLLASVNRMKSHCPHTLSNSPSLFDAHGPLCVQTYRDRPLFRTHSKLFWTGTWKLVRGPKQTFMVYTPVFSLILIDPGGPLSCRV